jgi:ribose transport system ATP-binding protein
MVTGDTTTPLLEMRGIEKAFGAVRALRGVDLEVRAGEVHCLLGQNGAGKSTLIKTLAGAHQPSAGTITWEGEPIVIADPQAALDLGIATMYQELDVVDGLTVAENVFLGHEYSTAGVMRRGQAARETRELLARLGHSEIPPNREVGELSAAHKQIVSLARALSRNARLIIMDEPSAVLDSEEVKNLFRVIDELNRQGVAVIYISHRLEEIREIGDRITVLKDGASMASGLSAKDTPTTELIRLMTGRTVEYAFPPRTTIPADAPVVLDVQNLALRGVFDGISFQVHAGEIVGLAGLVGSGRSEILETIYGARRRSSGTVSVAGRSLRAGSVRDAVAAGVGLAPEERKSQGLLLEEPNFRNVTLATFARFARGPLLDERRERRETATQIAALDLRPADPDRITGTLSGGNQQKIMLGRWLVHGTDVLLLDEPTRGVDVGARADIYALISRLADDGAAIVVVSSEIPEVLGLADRVLVIGDGHVLREAPATELDEPSVLDLVMKGNAA